MHKAIVVTAALLSLSACQNVVVEPETEAASSQTAPTQTSEVIAVSDISAEEQAALDKLDWVLTADAAGDAKAAMKSGGKPKLLAFSGRSKTHPGLTPAQYDMIKDKVVSEFAPGMGDVLYGDLHKERRKQARAYAKAYNTLVFEAVSN